jgi:hypothetical protein
MCGPEPEEAQPPGALGNGVGKAKLFRKSSGTAAKKLKQSGEAAEKTQQLNFTSFGQRPQN